MKKVIYSVAIVATMALASCGGSPSVCDCAAEINKGEKADKDVLEKCKKLGEGKSDEEKKKMVEELANCK